MGKDTETKRQKDEKTNRQKDNKTKRPKDQKTKRKKKYKKTKRRRKDKKTIDKKKYLIKLSTVRYFRCPVPHSTQTSICSMFPIIWNSTCRYQNLWYSKYTM